MLKMRKTILCFMGISLVMAIFFGLGMRKTLSSKYANAIALFGKEEYDDAIICFEELGDYEDSIDYIEKAQKYITYNSAVELLNMKKFEAAAQIFSELGEFEDSEKQFREAMYRYALALYEEKKYEEATLRFQELGDYEQSKLYVAQIALILYENRQATVYEEACRLYSDNEYELALTEFEKLDNYSKSVELAQKCKDAIKRQELATTISAGIRYSVGIEDDKTVVSTGYNKDGQSDIEQWTDIVSVSAKGVVTIGLKSDGTVVAAHHLSNIDVSEWEDIIAVSAGERFVIGLKNDGTLESEGHDMGDNQTKVDDWTGIVCIATGWRHTVGLDENGRVHITGYGAASQEKEIKEWENIIAIAAGGGSATEPGKGHTVGLRADHRVVVAGDKSYGQGEVEDWEDIIAVAAGDWHTVGLKSDGTVVSTKPDPSKYPDLYAQACEVEDWEDIVAIAAGCGTTIGLKSDGRIVAVGYDDYNQTRNANKWEGIKRYNDWPIFKSDSEE